MRTQVSFVSGRRLVKYCGPPKVKFKGRGRVILPAMLPLTKFERRVKWSTARTQSRPTWSTDEPTQIQNSCGTSCPKQATASSTSSNWAVTNCASCGKRPSIMGNESAHEAQYAAGAVLWAERRPSHSPGQTGPPVRNFLLHSVPWQPFQKESTSPVASSKAREIKNAFQERAAKQSHAREHGVGV